MHTAPARTPTLGFGRYCRHMDMTRPFRNVSQVLFWKGNGNRPYRWPVDNGACVTMHLSGLNLRDSTRLWAFGLAQMGAGLGVQMSQDDASKIITCCKVPPSLNLGRVLQADLGGDWRLEAGKGVSVNAFGVVAKTKGGRRRSFARRPNQPLYHMSNANTDSESTYFSSGSRLGVESVEMCLSATQGAQDESHRRRHT